MIKETTKRGPGRPRKQETASSKETVPQAKETASGRGKVPQVQSETLPVRKRRVGNPAMTGDAITATPSENAAYIQQGLRLMHLPDIDLRDPVAVQARIDEYFAIVTEYGNKPTVAGLGLALNGMDRRRLWEIRSGQYGNTRGETAELPREVTVIIKRTYKIMEELWESYMQNGKINPVSGIFLGKNNYGYQDRTEYVVTPNPTASDFSEKQLLERYGIDSDLASDSDSDSDADS